MKSVILLFYSNTVNHFLQIILACSGIFWTSEVSQAILEKDGLKVWYFYSPLQFCLQIFIVLRYRQISVPYLFLAYIVDLPVENHIFAANEPKLRPRTEQTIETNQFANNSKCTLWLEITVLGLDYLINLSSQSAYHFWACIFRTI